MKLSTLAQGDRGAPLNIRTLDDRVRKPRTFSAGSVDDRVRGSLGNFQLVQCSRGISASVSSEMREATRSLGDRTHDTRT